MNKERKAKADWLSWTLHLFVGLPLGLCIGWFIIHPGRHVRTWLSPDARALFLAGVSLITGVIASQYGDRLWVADNYRLFPPEAPRQNAASRFASLLMGFIGAGLVVVALYRHVTSG